MAYSIPKPPFNSRLNQVATRLMITVVFATSLYNCNQPDPFQAMYESNCSSCHADNLQGTPLGSALVGVDLKYGEHVHEISKSIREGYPLNGMPAFSGTLNETQINSISIFVSESRLGYDMADFRIHGPLQIPEDRIESEHENFLIESVAKDLHRWPYSIAPLPDGRILLTEKTQGLRIVSADGGKSELIRGLPKIYDDAIEYATLLGLGWMFDVTIHPEYEENGWIYLSYGDRCSACNEISRVQKRDVSMCVLIRGRINEGEWTDQEIIWKADLATYTTIPEPAVGGRICFDNQGYVYLSVGAKRYRPHPSGNIESYVGIQDLSLPYGKIYRIHDDGRIPVDNPFVHHPDAIPSIWTYGHRSPQGLEIDKTTGLLWGTEMGPRGGDEVNLLIAGNNYGWPLYSYGVNYDGSMVEFGKYLGIAFDLNDIEMPVVDLTPSPAVSSFAFYHGDVFAKWKGNLIIGSLKATELYRMELNGREVVHRETLLKDFARIRDVEVGYDGNIYLLLEHASGGQIVRLVIAGEI